MTPKRLTPKLELLTQEYVLIQAWKKTVSYIRSYNWYADTLELDRAAVDLPDFIKSVQGRLSSPNDWESDPLRLVPAPKSQCWHVDYNGMWKPVNRTEAAKRIRPLAHISLRDQVVATALMLCLADRVETLQGDPRVSLESQENRKKVISYGNRLYCDALSGGKLTHRWGSSKLYRGFFQDYRSFLRRPEVVAENEAGHIVVVHSDLSQFFDRVTSKLLFNKLESLKRPSDDDTFFDLIRKVMCWRWHPKDEREVLKYANCADIDEFSSIALPQGGVASGFFANVVMLDFDSRLRNEIDSGHDFVEGIKLLDVCRYVDDFRLVLSCHPDIDPLTIKERVAERMQALLGETAPGTILSKEKTQIGYFRGDQRPVLRQSSRMERIQHAVSGGFDAVGGIEILEAIQGLTRAQARYSKDRLKGQGWIFAPVADVRNETVARFAAGRFRTTFRSLRPLLDSGASGEKDRENFDEESIDDELRQADERKSQAELDDDARSFALGLIENWVEDPSKVRLLRIGLDLWPAKEIIEKILELLGQYTSKGGGRSAPRRIAWYCLAEIFRAGATETGFVRDDECLPDAVDLKGYREALLREAKRLLDENFGALPWYLHQQILLFLATYSPKAGNEFRQGRSSETKHYRELIRYLCGKINGLSEKDFAIYAILARRSFKKVNKPVQLAGKKLNSYRARFIAERDPSFAVEIFEKYPQKIPILIPRIRHELCLNEYPSPADDIISLAELVLSSSEYDRSKIGNELTLLSFAENFLIQLNEVKPEVVTPSDVYLSIDKKAKPVTLVKSLEIRQNKIKETKSLYGVPKWCREDMRWRIQLGYILRFILTGQHDFSISREAVSWKENSPIYRIPQSHWFKRIYGLHSGYTAFGADWLPISDWTEQFLYALLRWPGCRSTKFASQISFGIENTLKLIRGRIQTLQGKIGGMSETLMLPLSPNWPQRPPLKAVFERSLRVCVVQTVVPSPDDIKKATDLTLSDPALRKRHRQHLSAAFAAIKRMLNLRETHKATDGAIDLLILPELSVHPNDVETHLVPFSRANGTIILAGLTYEELFSGAPLVNSALWVIPAWSKDKGLEVLRRRQGKLNLAPEEKCKNLPVPQIQGFRPCQWLVGYPWSNQKGREPFWLSGAVCYDATDIRLACDLRDESDLFAVSAYNKDVKTFDQMAVALQYHMFQMVVIANNGYYGGSNAYVPYSNPYERQVFHLHGKQALMAFIEIENIQEFKNRKNHLAEIPAPPDTDTKVEKKWKCPPAGICPGEVCPHK